MSFSCSIENGPFFFTKARFDPCYQIESCSRQHVANIVDGIRETGNLDKASSVAKTSLPAATMSRRMEIGDDEMPPLPHDSRKFTRKTAEVIHITHRKRTDGNVYDVTENWNRQAIGLH